MRQEQLAAKYARALFDKAADKKKEAGISKQLDYLRKTLEEHEALKTILQNPEIARDDKLSLIEDISKKADLDKLLVVFLSIIIFKNRIYLLSEICDKYKDILYQHTGKEQVQVESAFDLSSKHRNALQNKIENLIKKDVILNVITNKELLGGLRINYAGNVYDASLKGQLEELRSRLLRPA